MPFSSSGQRRHKVELQNPSGEAVSDGDGEYQQEYETFARVQAAILPATAENTERYSQNTVVSTATHLVILPFLPGMGTDAGVSTKTRIRFGHRLFFVRGYSDPEERNIEIVTSCQEEIK